MDNADVLQDIIVVITFVYQYAQAKIKYGLDKAVTVLQDSLVTI